MAKQTMCLVKTINLSKKYFDVILLFFLFIFSGDETHHDGGFLTYYMHYYPKKDKSIGDKTVSIQR